MDTVRLILLVLHLLGMAALFGGLLAQAGAEHKAVNGAMRDGVGTAFLAGLALTGIISASDEPDNPINNAKIAVKLVVGLVLLVLVMANMRKERIPQGLWLGLVGLVILNVVVAVVWSPAHV